MSRPATAVLGAGRLARALAPALARAGYPVVAVASRGTAAARGLARGIPGAVATSRIESAVARARLVLLAVPDREIAGVARRLAADGGLDWPSRVVLHHAGALGPEPLAALARRGAGTGVLHPLQCLGRPEVARRILPGSSARIEGDRRGREAARGLARALGLRVLLPSRRPSPSDRAAYHAAASLASNDLVALIATAVDVLAGTGVPRSRALEALVPLARGTLAHLEAGGLDAGLTGPVARGDAATVGAQLRRLRRGSRPAGELHRLLSLRLARLARERGVLPPGEARDVLRVLREPPAR